MAGIRYTTSSEGGITPALVIAAGSVLPALALTAVALRFYCRTKKQDVNLGIDDWLILFSVILTTGLGVILIVGVALHGVSYPTDLPPGKEAFLTYAGDALLLTEKIFYAFNLTQCWAFGMAKASVLFFYRRIFKGRIFDIVSISLIVAVAIWTLGFFFAILFRCGNSFWALWAPLEYLLEYCYKSTPMFQAFSISDVITDILILAIPIYWVNQLHLPLRRRLAICGVFLIGLVAITAGIIRLVFFIKQSQSYEENQDGVGHLTTEMYWSMIEMGLSVIAACLPTVRLLFGEMTPESVLRSIRSRISLRSQNSLASSTEGKRTPPGNQTKRADYEGLSLPENGISEGQSHKPGLESWELEDIERS